MDASSAAAADESSSIFSILEAGGGVGIYRRVASLLLPFGDLVSLDSHDPAAITASAAATKKKKKKPPTAAAAANKRRARKAEAEAEALRPLAKRFLPFLSRALKLLPYALQKCPREEGDRAAELFGVYRLVLDCLACVTPCLTGDLFLVHLQRCSLLCCLENWEKYSEAVDEGVSLLESVASVVPPAAPKRSQNGRTVKCANSVGLLPAAEGTKDEELAELVTKVVVRLSRCAYKSKTKNEVVYRHVLLMMDEIRPQLRLPGSEAFWKYQLALEDALCKCSLFLAAECMSFDANLVYNFCLAMLKELLKSSSADRFPKIARQVCSSICLQWERRHLLMLEMLRCSLDSISCKCQGNVVYMINQCFEFVHYVVDNCQTAHMDVPKTASELLYEWRSNLYKVSSHAASIVGIYAIGLSYTIRNIHAQHRDANIGCSNDASLPSISGTEQLKILVDSLDHLGCYLHISGGTMSHVSVRCEREMSSLTVECKTSKSCSCTHGEISLLSYLDAFGFLWKQLEDYVDTAWKLMISENKGFHSADLNDIQNALCQFCDLCLCEFSKKRESVELDKAGVTLICAAVASLKISLGTREGIQRILTCINRVISCEWIQPQELKYLASSFYNMGASLYNVGQVEKASIALRLCSTTLWAHVTLLCKIFLGEPLAVQGDNICKDVIKDAVGNACAKSAVALDIICQFGDTDLHSIVVNCLLSWSTAEELLETSSSPVALVKQWVKAVCKDSKDVDAVDSVPALYPLLSSKCATLSKRTLGIILEQEILAYEELEVRHPNVSRKMQTRLIDILLRDIYVTEKYILPRSRILVKKGQICRTCGSDGLNSSLQCLSEAISLLEPMCSDTSGGHVLLQYQLALTYFLRAHCSQEANQKMEVMLHDIGCALRWWSSISKDVYLCLEYDQTVHLLCCIADLVALKGHLHFLLEICKFIVILGKMKNIPVENCVAMLWSSRRLGHAFCSSPIDENFIWNMSEELGVCANTISFWMDCMRSLPSSLVGFLQSLLLSDSISPQRNSFNSGNILSSQITIEEVKKAASSLTSSVPVDSHSAFVAGILFFDLSERLFSMGQLFEALSNAREALRLRKKTLQGKFIYSLNPQSGKVDTIWNNDHLFTESFGSVITKDWPNSSKSQSLEDCIIISPWNVLRCYLESILQVGVIYESLGNGVAAENFLRMGKNISGSLGFPVLSIAFSHHLGQVYRKKQLLDLAENELEVAKRILLENNSIISCNRCKIALEATIHLQAGDLHKSIFESTSECINGLSNALSQYKLGFEKLNLIELKSSFDSCMKMQMSSSLFGKGSTIRVTSETCHTDGVPFGSKEKNSTLNGSCARITNYVDCHCDGPLSDHQTASFSKVGSVDSIVNVGGRRKPKLASKHTRKKQTSNIESTLSTHHKSQNQNSLVTSTEFAKKHNVSEYGSSTSTSVCPDICRQEGTRLGPGEELQQICGCNEASVCSKTNCWRCFLVNVIETGLMCEIIYVKWECHRRRLLLRLLSKIGRCMGIRKEGHEVHEKFWQSMSLLFYRDPLCQSGTPVPCILEIVGIENQHDIFPIQRAVLLYNMGLFCIKDSLSEGSRTCCSLSKTQIPVVLSWLLTAFILTREIPFLFQKVSRLIAAILLLSMSIGHSSLPIFFESLTGNHLAAFFHQASVGTYLQHMYVSSVKDKYNNCKDFETSGSTGRLASSDYIRVAPEKLSDLEEFVNNFFKHLPRFSVICISLLGGDYVNLLGETLLLPSFFPAWMLLSRFDPEGQPIVMLLPVNFLPEDFQDDATHRFTSESKESIRKWKCPWGCTLLDYVAPQYKVLLEENYLSMSETAYDAIDARRNRLIWWSERSKLDNRLHRFLRNMEDSWLGPWRCLLLGACSDVKLLDSVVSRLSHVLKSECEINANTSFLKAVLGGTQSSSDVEACLSQLLLYGGYLGRGGCCLAESFRIFSSAHDGGVKSLSEATCRLIREAVNELVREPTNREPVVLVLDADLQMVPWENMPILRKEEAYRMPSIGSISATLGRNFSHEQAGGFDAFVPSVDPLDAYYVLNPGGDLSSTQMEFEEWFVNQKWKGKAGKAPTTEELIDALQNHDLFLYFGHGSGTQYIPENEIQKLDHCAATLLMGCNSGSFYLKGCYAPSGAPLSYLLAGSPVVIANLWEVTDKDIDRFGRAMLDSWLHERAPAANCAECKRLMQENGCLEMDAGSTRSLKTQRKAPRDKKPQEPDQHICRSLCKANRIASFMCQARDICKLPLLIGASPVCYGVPTLIRKHRY